MSFISTVETQVEQTILLFILKGVYTPNTGTILNEQTLSTHKLQTIFSVKTKKSYA